MACSWVIAAMFLLVVIGGGVEGQDAPSPSSSESGPLNVTAILEKAGQFNTFCRLFVEKQLDKQINGQLNSNNTEGLTLFAPTDNAFDRLKAGTINNLSDQKQVNLILNHFISKYYEQDNLLTVSNPVRTQYSDGGLNFTGQSHNVNVSSGLATTQVNSPIRDKFPLAVYPVNEVLISPSLLEAEPPTSSAAPPPPPKTNNTTSSSEAEAPSSSDASGSFFGLAFALLAFAFHHLILF